MQKLLACTPRPHDGHESHLYGLLYFDMRAYYDLCDLFRTHPRSRWHAPALLKKEGLNLRTYLRGARPVLKCWLSLYLVPSVEPALPIELICHDLLSRIPLPILASNFLGIWSDTTPHSGSVLQHRLAWPSTTLPGFGWWGWRASHNQSRKIGTSS